MLVVGQPGTATLSAAAELLQEVDEVVVAIEDRHDGQLVDRTLAARAACAPLGLSVWVTPLPAIPLTNPRTALAARLGHYQCMVVDDAASPVVAPSASTPAALVVMRAQPFHIGHLALVEHAATIAKEVVVVIAAAEQAFSSRNPFTAGERLQMARAATLHLHERVHLVAVATPVWPAMALAQLADVAPAFDVVVTRNPVLTAMALHDGIAVERMPQSVRVDDDVVSATAIRSRLATEGVGPWLSNMVPTSVLNLLVEVPLADRCMHLQQPEHS